MEREAAGVAAEADLLLIDCAGGFLHLLLPALIRSQNGGTAELSLAQNAPAKQRKITAGNQNSSEKEK